MRRDVLPALDEVGVKLFVVGIGSVESARTFAESVELPADLLLADESAKTDAYAAIGSRNTRRDEKGNQIFEGIESMWSKNTNDAIKKRGRDDLNAVVGSLDGFSFKPGIYKPLMPKGDRAMERTFIQGATFVFDGSDVLLAHYDYSSGDHADLEEVVRVATRGLPSRLPSV